jgi:hypothetical protein
MSLPFTATLGDYYAVRAEGHIIKSHSEDNVYSVAGGCKRHLTFEELENVQARSSHSLVISRRSPIVIDSIPNCKGFVFIT